MNTKIVFLILLTICSSFQMRAIHTDQATDSKIQQAHETVAKTTLFQKTKNFLCSPYLRAYLRGIILVAAFILVN